MAEYARTGIVTPEGSDEPTIVEHLDAIATVLEAIIYRYTSGPESNLPASPSADGEVYHATDTCKVFSACGANWRQIYPPQLAAGQVTTTELADSAVTPAKIAALAVATSAIQNGAVTSQQLADGAVTPAKVANTLKPSAGATAADEALRALGTAGGQALPGNHPSVTNARAPTAHHTNHRHGGSDELYRHFTIAGVMDGNGSLDYQFGHGLPWTPANVWFRSAVQLTKHPQMTWNSSTIHVVLTNATSGLANYEFTLTAVR